MKMFFQSCSPIMLVAAAGTAFGQGGDDRNDHRKSNRTITVVCESRDGRRHRCATGADVRFGVQLTRQISRTNCVRSRIWGSDQNGIWVSNGCRAEFTLNTRGGSR